MRLTRKTDDEREPIGIVIADGGRGDQAPRLCAFVWGPVPDDAETPDEESLLLAAAH